MKQSSRGVGQGYESCFIAEVNNVRNPSTDVRVNELEDLW